MTSKPHGKLVLLVWSDNGVIKPLVLDTGAIPVTETDPLTTIDAEIKACAITLPVAEQSPLTTIDTEIKACAITLPVAEQSPLEWIRTRNYSYWGGSWRVQPVIWGFSDKWVQHISVESVGDTYTLATTTAVPAGYVYVLEQYHLLHTDTVAREVALEPIDDSISVMLYQNLALAGSTIVYAPTRITLSHLDTVRLAVKDLTSGKTAQLTVWGYKTAIS